MIDLQLLIDRSISLILVASSFLLTALIVLYAILNKYITKEDVIRFFQRMLLHIMWIKFRIKNRVMFRHPKDFIPWNTPYCYSSIKKYSDYSCPFFLGLRTKYPTAYCYFINQTDAQDAWILYDSCKECGVNGWEEGNHAARLVYDVIMQDNTGKQTIELSCPNCDTKIDLVTELKKMKEKPSQVSGKE